MKIAIAGAGRMGQAIAAIVEQQDDLELAGFWDRGGDLELGVEMMREALRVDPDSLYHVPVEPRLRERLAVLANGYGPLSSASDREFMRASLHYLRGNRSEAAASLGRASMSFFGTETPQLYGPRDGRHMVFYKDLPCSPCLSVFNYKQSHCEFASRCLELISFEEVAAAFDRWWEANSPRAGREAHA